MDNISVCMATYNGGKHLKQQLESILSQLSADDEIIVSDDGSTDDTIQIVNSFADGRIKVISNTGNKGVNGNFENALLNSKEKYIFLADQDDIWFINKIRVMLDHLEKYDVVNCDCEVVNDELQKLYHSYFNYINSGPGLVKNLKRNTYMGNCMAFKREILNIALPFPPRIPNHDLWIGVVADLFYKPYFIPEVLGSHRRHASNASNTFDVKIKTSVLKKIIKRIMIIIYLPLLFIRMFKYKRSNRGSVKVLLPPA